MRLRSTIFLTAALCALVTNTALAQRDLKDIPIPDPELERKSFQVAEGFEVNLFAGDPKIAKPIQMNFDPQGRLWIASSEIYPHIKPGQKANDKILILEDTDGDGQSDKTTVFAEGLLIPTAVVPGDGGVYVGNSTELLHFSDTDGDGKADRKRIVLSGFGTEDTHHIVHTLRLGARRHAVLQSVDLHPQPHRNALRRPPPQRGRHLAIPSRDDGVGRLHARTGQPLGAPVRPLGSVVRD